MKRHVFIDSNIYLGHIASGVEAKSTLARFEDLVRRGAVRLYIPEQVFNEFNRNRESIIRRSLDDLREKLALKSIPALATWYKESANINVLRAQLAGQAQEVCAKFEKLAGERKLPADKWFASLVSVAGLIKPSDQVRQRAVERAALKNPPGKGDEVCDRIIWETVLESVPWLEELHVISDDPDYRSPLNPTVLHGFLADEWQRQNADNAHLHRDVASFLQVVDSNAEYTRDMSRRLAIHDGIHTLEHSESDDALDEASVSLGKNLRVFEMADLKRILHASKSNGALVWQRTEGECGVFFTSFLSMYAKHFDAQDTEHLVLDFPNLAEWRQPQRSNLRVVAG